jgi:hypothetical protein
MMSSDVQALIHRSVIRYLNGDVKEFHRLARIARELYELERHLYVSIREILVSKGMEVYS